MSNFANYNDGRNQSRSRGHEVKMLHNMIAEMNLVVDSDHHHQEGYRQAMNEAISVLERTDLRSRSDIKKVLETLRDLTVAGDHSGEK